MTEAEHLGNDPFCPVCRGGDAGIVGARASRMSIDAVPRTAHEDRPRIVKAGQLMVAADRPIIVGACVLVRDGRIAAVTDALPDADLLARDGFADAEIIDLNDCFVMPGLIDCHVHLLFENATGSGVEFFQKSDAHWAVDGAAFGLATLRAGFTTVRDCGNLTGTPAIYALRDGFADGKLPGPRTQAASAVLSVTGGAGDPLGFRTDAFPDPAHSGIADGPYECRRAVRRQVKAGADFIKVTMTGGILSDSDAGVEAQFRDDEIRAIVEEAHHWGRKVAVHAHSSAGVNAALRAGADSIEHGTYLDDESLDLFAKTGAWLVPTLLAGQTVIDMARSGLLPRAVRDKALRVAPDMQINISKAIKAGVKIAFGTDSGVSRHGQNAAEFELLVAGGMTRTDAIRAATSSAAELLGLDDEIGSLDVGKWADIIALPASPLLDVANLCAPVFVMQKGWAIQRPLILNNRSFNNIYAKEGGQK